MIRGGEAEKIIAFIREQGWDRDKARERIAHALSLIQTAGMTDVIYENAKVVAYSVTEWGIFDCHQTKPRTNEITLEDEAVYLAVLECLAAGLSLPLFITAYCPGSMAFAFFCARAHGNEGDLGLTMVGRGAENGFTRPFHVTAIDPSGMVGQVMFPDGKPPGIRIMPPQSHQENRPQL